jgi:hypothetical protein
MRRSSTSKIAPERLHALDELFEILVGVVLHDSVEGKISKR